MTQIPVSTHWGDTKWFALSVRGHRSLCGGADGNAAQLGAPRLSPSASSPDAPTSDHAACWTKSILRISGPGRNFDSWGNGHGGESQSVKCQLVACFPGLGWCHPSLLPPEAGMLRGVP